MHTPFTPAHFAALIATLTIGASPAGQQVAVDCDVLPDVSHGPVVVVTTPSAGTTLAAGTLTVQGAAFDCAADVGTGVDRVSVFLDRRDAGGLHLGEATLRQPNPIHVAPADQYSSVGWTLTAAVPLKPGQVNNLYVYARSSLTSLETEVALPIVGGGAADSPPTTSPAPFPPSPTPASAQGGVGDTAPGETQGNTISPANNTPDAQDGSPVPNADEAVPATVDAAPESGDVPVVPIDEVPAQ